MADQTPGISNLIKESGTEIGIAIWNASGLPPHFTTGVGKVYINLALEFSRMPGPRPTLLLPRSDTVNSVANPADSPIGHLPFRRIGLDRVALEVLWRTFSRPTIDRWAADSDWIYCPRELWAPPGHLKSAITVHDVYQFEPDIWTGSARLWLQRKLVWQRAIERADLVFAVSRFTRDRILALFRCDPEKIVIVPNAVDTIFEQPPIESDEIASAELRAGPYVLHVGGLTRKKGGDAIVALAHELSRRDSGLRILTVGPVEPEFETARGCPKLSILKRGLAPESLQALTHNARIAILPSEYEGFGIPLLEAMAAGIPVIGSDRASIPEILGDGGQVVDPSDTSGFADLVESHHLDSDLRNRSIAYGRKRVNEFSWKKSAAIIRDAMLGFD